MLEDTRPTKVQQEIKKIYVYPYWAEYYENNPIAAGCVGCWLLFVFGVIGISMLIWLRYVSMLLNLFGS